ncbi:asparagine synthase (glutamine-hydrolyzing) [Candidatus Marinarcus aquaticus]|uniref:asparagine synthase (glutamine-hydrolyzing) n=1 Tax=Candidatus Marinarcus aquaticus TaxID=2044504 RepID=A0A4Q0XN32_9BACT|nr:asparagine synthase (glutamine-hydrolyzing) [Candidatus Marinarcus aquaticus]RXJ54411.1 asparagine synthase (glutamine-hydrolyzing) [Candidatus Marinarcus aquaticus]
MCGIVGFLSEREDKIGILKKQLETLYHRGPDDQRTYIDNKVAFGHSRLAIIDINHAQQPMQSLDERYVLVFNGEIYNYLELRQHLVSKGIQFKTYSDTEVLLNMYIVYGKECVNKLNGMFAFAIYDKHKKSLFLARDHFGIKPLYYTYKGNDFIFASEIKAILKYPEIKKEVDQQSLNEYMTFQVMLKKHTLFKNIHSLEPGTFLYLEEGKIKEKKKYWDFNYNIDDSISEEEYTTELLHLLENSLNIQTRSDVPVGAYLSGGIDSSLVSTLASKNYFGDFHTFSGGFKESPDFDETQYAKIVHQSIHSVHHEIFPTSKDFLDNFENIVYHMDYPEAGPGVFSQYMVSKLASEHVKVVLGGQGGDEIFGGYTRYAVAYLEQALKGAIFETSEEGKHLVTLQSIIPNMSQMKNYVPLLKEQFKEGLFEPMDERYYRMMNRSHNLHKIYNQGFLSTFEEGQLLDKFKQVFNHPDTKSYFNKMTHFDLKTLLPALLHVEDRMSMAVSIESRVPILDYRIIELASKMPPSMKFSGGKTKAMLIKSVKNILPKEIIERKDKMGFPTPINNWLAGDLKEYALDILTSQKAKQRGYLNTQAIEKQINESGKFSRDLWGALNLEMWHRKYID